MISSLEELTFRPPTMDDAQQVLKLMSACEVNEYGESDSDIEDLTHDWEQIELAQDTWLAFTSQGDLVGYGGIFPYLSGFRIDIYISPFWKNDQLIEKLLGCSEGRAHALIKTHKLKSEVICRTYLAHVNRRQRNFFEKHGYQAVNYHFQMHIHLDKVFHSRSLPDNVELRTMRPGQDEHAILELIQTAFEHPGRAPQTFEEWKEFMMWKDIFRPELWFLATIGDELIGTCLCFQYAQLGWVRQLAVLEGWRRKGLGSVLLRHAFNIFKERGCENVGLVVDSDNPKAYLFYQSLGMQKMRQYDQYTKMVS